MSDERVPDLSAFRSPPRQSLDYQQIETDKDPIGSGGQAIVYRATLSGTSALDDIAIKEPLADHGTLDRATVQAFFDEANTWKTVDTREREKPRWQEWEHIVGVIDTGDRLPWIAMEYMDGGGLDDRLETNPDGLSVEEALWIGECVCLGLELAHTYGIVHLDLKPANILFRETPAGMWDVPKIADWGLARLLAERTGTMDGLSVKYAAPEQFEPTDFGEPDTLTDVYQVGALVYAMLTGEPPYTGSQLSVMRDIVSDDPPDPPGGVREGLSEAIDEAVLLALETEKTERYRSIQTFEQALRAIRTGGSLPPRVSQRIGSAEDSESRTASTETTKVNAGSKKLRQSDENTSDEQTGEADATDQSKRLSGWPMFKRGPARTGNRNQSAVGPRDAVVERWRFPVDDPVKSSPAVSDGTIYIGSHDNNLYALNADDGTERWRFTADDLVYSSPSVVDGTVYFGSNDGHVYAVDTSDGTERWRFKTDRWVWSSPTVVDGTVYVGSNDCYLYALDTSDGTISWRFQTDGQVHSSPAVADGTVFVGSYDANVYGVDASDGTSRWRFHAGRRVSSSPAVVDGTVYFGSFDGNVYAVDSSDGSERWSVETAGQVKSSPAISDGTVYIGSHDKHVYAFDASDGTEQWRFQTDAMVTSCPAVTDDTVYVGSFDNHVYALDASDGTERWGFEADGRVSSSPAVANGTVFFGTHNPSAASDNPNIYALSEAMSFEKDDSVVLHDKHSEYDGERGRVKQVMETMFGDTKYTISFEDGQETGVPEDALEAVDSDSLET